MHVYWFVTLETDVIVPLVCFCGNVFSELLPSNVQGADHIENTYCNTFSIVACAYFGHYLEMAVHVTICCQMVGL
jgi:hypothetical protein